MTNLDDNSNGILYVATGKKFLDLALISYHHLRKVEPEVKVAIWTDIKNVDEASEYFPIVKCLENPSYSYNDKIDGLAKSPFQKTIFLDSDTIPIRKFSEQVFRALDYYALVARSGMGFNLEWERTSYPECLTQFNTGVIAFNSSECGSLFNTWKKIRAVKAESHDQPSFRAAILDEKVRVGELSASYNYLDSNFLVDTVKIIHCVSYKKDMIEPKLREKLIKKVYSIRPPALAFRNFPVMNNRKLSISAVFNLVLFYIAKKVKNLKSKISQQQ